ncbi:MAG: LysR family transcriptional regulator [Alphaproteobacteria bacterium]|nr:LysR family transcriptional regulator [Alphaproteobacteria bacterium]
MRFDLTDLRLFLHVAQAGNITAAAARSNIALASASERIRGMEDTAGVALLARRPRGVELTPAGRAVAHHARLLLQQFGALAAELSSYAEGLRGHVRVAANASALSEFLPDPLNAFLDAHHGIDIDLEERQSPEIVRLVTDDIADIGIIADFIDVAGLEVFPFAMDRLVVITPPRHRLGRRRRFAFRELLEEDFVGLVATNALQQHLAQHALQAGKPLRLRARLGSFEATGRMVASGIGIAIVPETAARRTQQTAAIRIVHLTDGWAMRQLRVCLRQGRDLPGPAKQLAEHLVQYGKAATMRAAEKA